MTGVLSAFCVSVCVGLIGWEAKKGIITDTHKKRTRTPVQQRRAGELPVIAPGRTEKEEEEEEGGSSSLALLAILLSCTRCWPRTTV